MSYILNGVSGAALALCLLATTVCAEEARVAEDQSPTGKFLTATEVRPILDATRSSWVAVREFNGQDLVYFTHLVSWRCGLYEVSYSLNGAETHVFPLPDCAKDGSNALMVPDGAQIFLTEPLQSVETVDVTLLYDDLSTETAHFERANILTP